jgi:hypothetical protein
MFDFKIYLRNKVTDLNIYLNQLPQRFDLGVRSRLILRTRQIRLVVEKAVGLDKAGMVIRTCAARLFGVSYIKARNTMVLATAHLGSLLIKFVHIRNRAILRTKHAYAIVVDAMRIGLDKSSVIIRTRPVNIWIVRLRKFQDMDGLALGDFDGMQLVEVDFIEI